MYTPTFAYHKDVLRKNSKKSHSLLFIISSCILVIGLFTTVYLVQKSQDIRQKAAENTDPLRKTIYGSTPIADVEKYPKPTPHVQIAANLDFGDYTKATLFKTYLANEYDYFWYNPGTWAAGQFPKSLDDYNQLWQIISDIKATNPNAKQGLYVGGVTSPDSYYWPYILLKNRDDLVLHRTDGSVIDKAPLGKAHPQDPDTFRDIRIMNLFNPHTTEEVANFWKDIFITKKIDGILLDGFDPGANQDWLARPYNHTDVGLGLADGCKEGPCNSLEYWKTQMPAYTTRLSQVAQSVDADVMVNGLSYSQGRDPNDRMTVFDGPIASNFSNYASGVLAEWTSEIYISEDRFKAYMDTIPKITAKKKNVFFWVMPRILQYADSNTYTDAYLEQIVTVDMERFFLGSYLLIQKNPYTYFGYHPGQPYAAYNGQGQPEMFFYKDWNMDYGNPTMDTYAVAPNGLYYRGYENGVVYVNPTDHWISNDLAPQQLYELWDPCGEPSVKDTMNFPPKSGSFLFYYTKGCHNK